jgi:hypothetical protein
MINTNYIYQLEVHSISQVADSQSWIIIYNGSKLLQNICFFIVHNYQQTHWEPQIIAGSTMMFHGGNYKKDWFEIIVKDG